MYILLLQCCSGCFRPRLLSLSFGESKVKEGTAYYITNPTSNTTYKLTTKIDLFWNRKCIVCLPPSFRGRQCRFLYNKTKNNFQRWISWLSQRWRTQRNAIRNANCRIQWIIKTLNANCASGYPWEHACMSVCWHHSRLLLFLKLCPWSYHYGEWANAKGADWRCGLMRSPSAL